MLENVSTNPNFNFSRLIHAPLEMVYRAWTEPQQVAVWWGPNGFTNPVCQLDVRPGGKIRIDMQDSFGTIHPMEGTFQELIDHEKIVFTSLVLNQAGRPIMQVLNTVNFDSADGYTKLSINVDVEKVSLSAKSHLDGMEEGWAQSLERLTNYLRLKMS